MFTLTSLKNALDNIDGISSGGVSVGLKTNPSNEKQIVNEPDVAFIKSDTPMRVEAIFTTNKFQAAPIVHYKKYKEDFDTDFILINAKNANAMTGDAGVCDIESIFDTLKQKLDITNPIMSSTGTIGKRLDIKKIESSFDKFDFLNKNSDLAARAIMTTDAFSKEIAFKVDIEDGSSFNIASICKGAGMIEPSMATMLCFIVTDANIPKSDMRELLSMHNETTFNSISVDGDTSTNDTVMLLANGNSKAYNKEAFSMALYKVMQHLSLEVVRDGEGARKLVAFEVIGAKSANDAKIAAKALSNSLLVKTALFGEDLNWGRVASTIGSSGIECYENKLIIKYDSVVVYNKSCDSFTKEIEKKAELIAKKDNYKIICDIGVGDFSYTAFGCDLGYEYIKINADYRT
jgi:glutamate N-acetyltransferase/amino-acid N-acetyltransferase